VDKVELPPIEKLATLARLELGPTEKERLGIQLQKILSYFEKLSEVDTEGVEASPYAVSLKNRFKEDHLADPRDGLIRGQDLVKQNAPAFEEGYYVVPPVMGGEEA
jgi:aspartyl-tRNA(Asn)/glutamyl-tRNA(Gln) amidotransferase subunit C